MLALLLVVLLPLVPERLIPGGVLHTLGSPSDPDSTGSSAGSKSVDRCEGMVAVAEVAEADEVMTEAVVLADAQVAEAEVAAAEAEAVVMEAGFKYSKTKTHGKHIVYMFKNSSGRYCEVRSMNFYVTAENFTDFCKTLVLQLQTCIHR